MPDPRQFHDDDVNPRTLTGVLTEQSSDFERPVSENLPAERQHTRINTVFATMSTEWPAGEGARMRLLQAKAQGFIEREFADLLAIIAEIQAAAREKGTDGRPNYAALSLSDKENWMLALAVGQFEWRQRAVAAWGDAMFGKVFRQEVFTDAYLAFAENRRGTTVEDRTQAGNEASMSEYYAAMFRTLLYKHATALCDMADVLGQRLKDALVR